MASAWSGGKNRTWASRAPTYVWYESYGPNGLTLVDSDMMLDPMYVTTPAQMTQTVSHEWGHAIGLAHSNVERTLMSGPPDSMYTNDTDLTADDVHGCRCLYGPPAGQTAGNVCSLPEIDRLRHARVSEPPSSESQVTVTNSGNAALVISGIRTGSGDFLVGTNGCAPGASLAPGASCTFGVLARLARRWRSQRRSDDRHIRGTLPDSAGCHGCRRAAAIARAELRGLVVDCTRRIRVRLGTQLRAPGRHNLRNRVYLRCYRQERGG